LSELGSLLQLLPSLLHERLKYPILRKVELVPIHVKIPNKTSVV